MALNLQAVCQLALLSLCCLLTTVRETEGTYVPGRCLCPETTKRVRGQLTDLKIYPASATCSNITVIVTLKSNNSNVCLNPEAPMGKQLIRCWERTQKLGSDIKVCLRRRRRRGGRRPRPQQKAREQTRRASSSQSK
ncbi:PREDICTED: C-X-C motif chemokine 10-like [Poecilia mexicana]|uniref:Chemokine interleukin-8-like domain-containing protein n=1 Tax=Poecilia mexicana TaxID=48701 RepID=A0A3B3WMV9_9TELE|nr:PREDICTED: C-X-C motif chemokine 10-like [Poecilia mexicana]